RLQALKDAYHPFAPEADLRSITVPDRAERQAARERLEHELDAMAVAANFTPIDPSEFERAMSGHSLLKVRLAVDLDVVDKVMFFRRGESVRTREIPVWFGLRRREVTFTNYSRVLVYATFKEADAFPDAQRLPFPPGSVIIKLFQNVPRDDLEMVLPNVQVRMRRIDKLLIGVPALISGVVVLVTKLFTTLGLLFLLLAFWIGLSDEPVTLNQATLISAGAGIIAFGAFLVRQVTKFKNRKILFMKALSENLYFRNLDNDAGVFHHLLDAAEEAELTEALLAYHFVRCAPDPISPAELDRRVEEWLAQRWDATMDFEVEDGLRKLRELSLVNEDGTGRLSAIGLPEARQRLDQIWDDIFTEPDPLAPVRLEQVRHG
ncbi:MAG: TMEM143 family protein, partial [Micromonosporaceae bacterium]